MVDKDNKNTFIKVYYINFSTQIEDEDEKNGSEGDWRRRWMMRIYVLYMS